MATRLSYSTIVALASPDSLNPLYGEPIPLFDKYGLPENHMASSNAETVMLGEYLWFIGQESVGKSMLKWRGRC